MAFCAWLCLGRGVPHRPHCFLSGGSCEDGSLPPKHAVTTLPREPFLT